MANYIVIFTTCASAKEAKDIAGALLEGRLVACANIVSPVESRFWWKGKKDSAKEALLILKARKANFSKIEKAIRRIHSYSVPEIIALPVVSGSRDYLKWIDENA